LKILFSSLLIYVSSLPSSFSWAFASFGLSSTTNSAFILVALIVRNIVSICLRKSGCTWLHRYMYTLVNKWLLKINKKTKSHHLPCPKKLSMLKYECQLINKTLIVRKINCKQKCLNVSNLTKSNKQWYGDYRIF
jgi:hypothetical protein